MLPFLSFWLASSSFIACSGDDDTAKDDADIVEDDAETAAFAPTAGTWHATGFDFSTDGCNAQTWFELDASTEWPYTVAAVDGGFTITNEAGATSNCTLTDMDFTCTIDPLVFDHSTNDPPLNMTAVTTTTTQMSGVFSDEGNATGTVAVGGTCEGEQCEDLATVASMDDFPCSSNATISFILQ